MYSYVHDTWQRVAVKHWLHWYCVDVERRGDGHLVPIDAQHGSSRQVRVVDHALIIELLCLQQQCPQCSPILVLLVKLQVAEQVHTCMREEGSKVCLHMYATEANNASAKEAAKTIRKRNSKQHLKLIIWVHWLPHRNEGHSKQHLKLIVWVHWLPH
ncbi:hypothetical protein DUNSADRAFT_1831 [Dunaliella salina]|uniref:Encoded protein n=1 Tax=Dunaliella salina TaxID=3046 RepID=A0ABQ7FWZ4_DUNSA|nr:hypothetical protein DUNSADRAFT_1831 [Dunaliella salina]|eukprot:KAF5826876.1 hypothetical protein DUNSADRAFT_1831 [Dunaliella salina]